MILGGKVMAKSIHIVLYCIHYVNTFFASYAPHNARQVSVPAIPSTVRP